MDSRLERVAETLQVMGMAAVLCDASWRIVWASDELKFFLREADEGKIGYGKHIVQAWVTDTWGGAITEESRMNAGFRNIPYIAWDTEGGIEQIFEWMAGKSEVELTGEAAPPDSFRVNELKMSEDEWPGAAISQIFVRLIDGKGEYYGNAILYESTLPAPISALLQQGDRGMYERMIQLYDPGRRAAAILFSDLEASAVLARRLSSAAYFSLVRSITTRIDRVVIDNQGIVGKHAGDGVTAFFLSSQCGGDSGAARAAVEAARSIGDAVRLAASDFEMEIGSLAGLEPNVNVAIHFGPNLFMGQLVTGGRLEVTALGDEVNECARILQSARGGGALSSKVLIERLSDGDAATLAINPDALRYEMVEELPGATEKAMRDAGGIPVTSIRAA